MKHYPIGTYISVFGAEKKHPGNTVQEEHSPRSVYMCEKCGYMELSRNNAIRQMFDFCNCKNNWSCAEGNTSWAILI